MKNKIILFLLLINSFGVISAQGFIKGEYKSYQYETEPRIVTKEEYYFDKDMNLASLVSKSVLDKEWDKEFSVNCKKSNGSFVIDMKEKNINYGKNRNDERTYTLQLEKDRWNLFYFDKLIGELGYSATQEECYYYSYKTNRKETFYSRKNNEYYLFNTRYVLKNGIFYAQNVDGYENYKLFDDNKYEINYSHEGLKAEYKFEKNYHCTDINNTCLLWILRNDVNDFLLPYLFCKIEHAYHATSYLTEGETTYEPEHLQEKDGLPWASGNGKGIGDVISIREFEKENPAALKIMNGYQDKNHPGYYEKNSRARRLKITNTGTGKSMTVAAKDVRELQTFRLGSLGAGNVFDIEVVDVYPGNKYDDLCIQYLVIE